MDKHILKQIIRENQQEVERYVVEPRNIQFDGFPCRVLVGVRRAGKSYMLYHRIQQLLAEGHKWDELLYLNFEDELERALGHSRYKSMDAKVSDLKDKHLQARVVNDYSGFSYRYDKNNVDIDTESVMLAANQIKYQGLMAGIKSEFSNLQLVSKSS